MLLINERGKTIILELIGQIIINRKTNDIPLTEESQDKIVNYEINVYTCCLVTTCTCMGCGYRGQNNKHQQVLGVITKDRTMLNVKHMDNIRTYHVPLLLPPWVSGRDIVPLLPLENCLLFSMQHLVRDPGKREG